MNRFNPGYFTEDELRDFGIASVGVNVRVARNCTIIGLANISIGDNVRIDGYSTITASGEGFLKLGSYIHLGGHSTILATGGVVMDDFTCISHGVRIYTTSDDYSGEFMTNPTVPAYLTRVTCETITLSRHVIVGSQSTILPGVQLAEGTAVGANSLVSHHTQPWSIYAGSPAKKIKDRKRNPLTLEKRL
ncbi:O-acetyltransferase, putative [Erwinia amylovora Ea644]|uniref:acyltransferase n=1 Tax=Erwinia amylovora TaxID=552 RepID=UPI0002C93C2E|nr:acyltransferase [Erwinia amylovora]CCP03994.1 O-acetyltransferase, putative [Erwinia amylovora Ea644]CCP08059.1 O-acetyltransferase, putative [Erwinia amylovora MR1]